MRRWSLVLTPVVDAFIEGLEDVVSRTQIRRDIDKLCTRGTGATSPLVEHYKGDVWYIRSKVGSHGLYRLFYMRDGETSFLGFHVFHKKSKRIPRNEKAVVAARFREITGKPLK